ncbi:hypothetical protein KY284_034506 [Solanum tuberosum]|nr:hypothetical protein KY284_034506 [Solanum tuberosum]
MEGHLHVVLLMGSGEGMGPIEATARALADALFNERLGEPIGQVLVICGWNKKLADRLNSVEWKNLIQVKGFVTKMEECMGVCDCIITKREDDIRLTSKERKETSELAGPGTIAEPMIRGLTIILNGNIVGQEAGNVPHVIENRCGKFSKSSKEMAKIVGESFGPRQDELKVMSLNALRLAKPDDCTLNHLDSFQTFLTNEKRRRKKSPPAQ